MYVPPEVFMSKHSEAPKPPPEKKRGFFSRFFRAIYEAEKKKVDDARDFFGNR